MDRNSIIGLVLILGILTVYYAFFSPQPPSSPQTTRTEMASGSPPADAVAPQSAYDDSLRVEQNRGRLGIFAAGASGQENDIILENADIRVTLSTRGGRIRQVLLKNYVTYSRHPLYLFDDVSNSMTLEVTAPNGPVDIRQLFFNTQESGTYTVAEADTQSVTFQLALDGGRTIRQTYTLPGRGFVMGYNLDMGGLQGSVANQPLRFFWKDDLLHTESDIVQSRAATTVNYYTAAEDFDRISEGSTGPERIAVNEALRWVSMKQKFFNASIIADGEPFTQGVVSSDVPQADTNIVKTLQAELFIPMSEVTKPGGGEFRFFFGPNQFNTLNRVTDGFNRNVYLGWGIFGWVNRFLIIPIFNFLENYIGSYGIIIIVLVLIIKVLLFPLTYKSYISMAKTKALKPEIDAIKEKYGDDMQKIQAEQMKLYSQVGINPISGCIPMLLQMPILFAMFNFFPNSIELRQEAFLWASDLSTYDSILNLPFRIPGYGAHVSLFTILMTLSTLALTWFNNQVSTVTGPMKSLTYVMPVVLVFVLNSLPAGLSFYYLISNLVTMGQQVAIRRFVDEDKIHKTLQENKVKNKDKKKSGFQQRLEEAMKAAEQQKKGKKD
jgi:YidC/Oxa1 family membrane protein insertase